MRRETKACLLAAGLLAAMSGAAGAEDFYRWTDADGAVHFTNRKEAVPKSPETAVERLDVRKGFGENGSLTVLPAARPKAAERPKPVDGRPPVVFNLLPPDTGQYAPKPEPSLYDKAKDYYERHLTFTDNGDSFGNMKNYFVNRYNKIYEKYDIKE
jgi:hypothetical protein